ncbi:MAG TPA: hypothetical protein VFF66_03875 [Brevundimonas sp.]|nr:hypothetical protein [Brevundimonas sp.]
MRTLLAIIVLLLSGCAMPQADPQRVEQATRAYGLARDGDAAAFAAQSTPSLRTQLTPQLMAQLRSYSSPGDPDRSRVLSWRSNTVAGGASLYEVVQQHEYQQRTVIVQVLMVRDDSGPWLVDGFHINAVSPAQAQAAAGFSLAGKSPLHYVVLIGAILAPLTCLGTAGVAAWRRRWGWMIFSLFGFGQLVLNWNTGEWHFQALHFSVLSAGFFKGMGPFDPWTLMLSLPIPAVLFWALRRYRPKVRPPKKGARAADPAPVPAATEDT